MKKIGLMVILMLIVLVAMGCKDEKAESKEKMNIEKLLNETNIAVMHEGNGLGETSWNIKQVEKTEVIQNTKLKNYANIANEIGGPGIPEAEIPAAGLIYNLWYGQDDLSTFSGAVQEGVKLGITRILDSGALPEPINNVVSNLMSALGENKEEVTIDYFSGKEDISHRTIKVMSYGFIGKEYEEVPYGVWKMFINQSTDSLIKVEDEDGVWKFTGGSKIRKNTLMTRTKSHFRFYNGQTLKQFPGIPTPNVQKKKTMEDVVITDFLRELTWDVYMVLDGKEPLFYPEYAKALVRSFEIEEEQNFNHLIGAMVSYDLAEKDYLSELKWGMPLSEVTALVPNGELKEANGAQYLTQEENRYAASTCVEKDNVFFTFNSGKLDSISYTFDLSEECNTIESTNKGRADKESRKLFEEIVKDYDPTKVLGSGDFGYSQNWDNSYSSFSLEIYTPYHVTPPSPSGMLTVNKVSDGKPVVMVEEIRSSKSSETEAKETAVSSTKNWEGEWSWRDETNGRLLEISKQSGSEFDFILNTHAGTRVRMLDGTARFTGEDKAEYKDKEYGCTITFAHTGKAIDVSTNNGCAQVTMDGTPFAGTYPKGETVETNDLSSSGILPENVDSNLKNLSGKDYENFVEYFETIFDGKDLDGFGATVITGFVKGATNLDGIIMYRENGDVWAAYHGEGNSVNYYTNVEKNKEEVTNTIYRYFKDKYQTIGIKYMSN